MLVHKQIKTLARPYTDRAMILATDRLALGPETMPAWSNLTVTFFEPGPKSPPSHFEPSVLTQANLERIQEWRADPGVQVWPVEIGPLGNLVLLRFIDQYGYSHWFDARYVSAILKRHSDPDWHYNEGRLMAKESTPVTVAVDDSPAVTLPKGDPIAVLAEWHWGSDAAAAIDNYRVWDPDWRLSNTGLDTWHTLRWAQRLDRVLPKGKKGSQFTHSGGSPARRVKRGKHKWIELASESGRACVRISLYNGEITDLTQRLNPDHIRRTMKRLPSIEMTREAYDVITAIRGPDCKVLARALKWVITGRIRFYVMRECFKYTVTRRDTRADSSWEKAHRDWDKAVEAGAPWYSLNHWAEHAELALRTIELCLTDAEVARQDEIHIMFDLLNAARTALDIRGNPDKIAQAAQFVHTQLTRLQNITDSLAQLQEVTNE